MLWNLGEMLLGWWTMVSWWISSLCWYTGCSDGRSLLCSFTTSLRIACGVVGKDVGY